jgi:flagellar biosynthesis/type III secretory pathway protein FliH
MARILKSDAALATGPRAGAARRLSAEVCEASLGAREILRRAEAEAARIRARAEADRHDALALAAEAGRQEGLARAAALLARAAAERDRLLASAERELVRLAVAVAEKVLARSVAADGEAVVAIAARVLDAARSRRQVSLRVNPEDAAALRRGERQLAGGLPRARSLEIREDPGVSRGGVVVETEGGTIDARLEVQLEALARALEEAAP